jgi:hypothetical protein
MTHGWVGAPALVQVLSPEQSRIEKRAKETLEGQTIDRVYIMGDQLHIELENGESLVMMCDGGFTEVA